MAEKNVVENGVVAEDDQSGDNFYDMVPPSPVPVDARISELNRKIELLERDNRDLISENIEIKERIEKMTAEIEGLKKAEVALKEKLEDKEKEIERSEEGKRATEAIAKRAVELETEVWRLQHDLISTMSGGEEANKEIAELKKVLGEKGEKVESLEKETEALKKVNAESEKKVRELERKLGVLEVKEVEEKSKKVRIEEEMKEKVDEKEKEISGLKKKIEDMEAVIVQNGLEIEKWIKEKLTAENVLKVSKEKSKSMELNMVEMQKKAEEAEKLVSGLKEKAVGAINGSASEIRENGFNGLKLPWPAVVGSTGVIIAATAVVCVWYGRRR